MTTRLTARTRLEDLRKEAKELWHALESGDLQARSRAMQHLEADEISDLSLVVCQNVIAREHGFPNWGRLKHRLAQLAQPVGSGFAQGNTEPEAQLVVPAGPESLEPADPNSSD